MRRSGTRKRRPIERLSQEPAMPTSAYDPNNIFARILRGDLPSTKVFEDERVVAIMDVMPQGMGHTLVIPKAPSRNLLDIGEDDLKHTIVAVQRIARAVKKAFDAPGVFVMQFNEPAAGQTVFHTHFHVIPRFEGVGLKPHTGDMADAKLLSEHAGKIKAALA
jgi:histidine triad (HIT) family protein